MDRKVLIPIFVILAIMFGACGVNVDINVDRGSGHVITETRSASGFDKVVFSGIGEVTILQGTNEGLEIEAEDNVIPHITSKVSGDTLEIGFDHSAIIPTETVKFRLTMRDVRSIETRGASNIQAQKIDTDQLILGISGTGNINIRDLNAQQVTINVSGAGNLNTEGKVDTQKITMSGAGNYNGEDLQSATADVTITGLGKATLWVTDSLDVTISGTGSVDYYGNPRVSQQISGLGRIKDMGNK